MRVISLIGIMCIALGGFVIGQGGGNVKTEDQLLKIGDVQVTTTKNHAIPPWTGAIAVAAGVAMLVSGIRKRG